MGSVVGDVLPLAVGVAISPMPIIAVILMLLASRAGATSAGFLAGWVAGIAVTAIVVTIIANTIGLSKSGGGSTAGGVVKIVLGAVIVLFGVKQWRGRPQEGSEPALPKWLAAVKSFTPAKATGLGLALAVNPKNLLLILSAGVVIGTAGLPVGQVVATIVVFTIIAAISVAAPVVGYRFAQAKARVWLGGLEKWLTANNTTVTMTLLFLIGVVLIGKGIGAL